MVLINKLTFEAKNQRFMDFVDNKQVPSIFPYLKTWSRLKRCNHHPLATIILFVKPAWFSRFNLVKGLFILTNTLCTVTTPLGFRISSIGMLQLDTLQKLGQVSYKIKLRIKIHLNKFVTNIQFKIYAVVILISATYFIRISKRIVWWNERLLIKSPRTITFIRYEIMTKFDRIKKSNSIS